jgi:hypothetical protein
MWVCELVQNLLRNRSDSDEQVLNGELVYLALYGYHVPNNNDACCVQSRTLERVGTYRELKVLLAPSI